VPQRVRGSLGDEAVVVALAVPDPLQLRVERDARYQDHVQRRGRWVVERWHQSASRRVRAWWGARTALAPAAGPVPVRLADAPRPGWDRGEVSL
jgi:hypothetical protein